jgi:hypothetical protein
MSNPNPNDDDRGKDTPVYTPYLNIRYDVVDTGVRPLAPGVVFWASPDILVSPTDAYGNVQPGTQVTIQAHVLNWGMAAAIAVKVDFYWLNPSLGFTAANCHLIGSTLVSVPAMNYVDVTCPALWTPVFVNGGHECLVVQCTCPQDPLTNPFQPSLDRHVGQRNLTVANPLQDYQLQLTATNLFGTEKSFKVQLSSLVVKGQFADWQAGELLGVASLLANLHSPARTPPLVERRLRLQTRDISDQEMAVRIVGMGGAGLQPAIQPAVQQAIHPEVRGKVEDRADAVRYMHLRGVRNPDFNSATLGKVLSEFALAPQATQVINIQVPRVKVEPGQFVIHRFTQVMDGHDVGGYTVIVPSA